MPCTLAWTALVIATAIVPSLQQPQTITAVSYWDPPDADWIRLDKSGHPLTTVIINPDSGAGSKADPAYATQVNASQAAGLTVLGYAHTSYGRRAIADVEADIMHYVTWYGVNGFFIDETPNADCSEVPYYSRLRAFITQAAGADAPGEKVLSPIHLYTVLRHACSSFPCATAVVINPGCPVPECYMNVSTVITTFESPYAQYGSWQPAGWEKRYPASNFLHIVYDLGAPGDLQAAAALSKTRHVGAVYFTPLGGANPYAALPNASFWAAELKLAAA